MLKKKALIVAVVFTLLLTIASFISLNSMPKTGLSIEDKLLHFAAYFVFAYLWYYAFKNHIFNTSTSKTMITAVVFAIIYGIIIEVLQGLFTANRVTEFNDAIANSLGAIFAGILIKLSKPHVKKL